MVLIIIDGSDDLSSKYKIRKEGRARNSKINPGIIVHTVSSSW